MVGSRVPFGDFEFTMWVIVIVDDAVFAGDAVGVMDVVICN
jgi:hypothetical protein